MSIKRTLQPPHWPRPKGYANGIEAEGHFLFLAGQIGWDENGDFPHKDLPGQFDQCLKNIMEILAQAEASSEQIVRMTWFVVDMEAYRSTPRELGRIYREHMGQHFPTMSVIGVSELVEKEALIEIEVTAVL